MALLIRSLACTYYDGYRIPPHRHDWAQLIYAASGVMRVATPDALWIVPPTRAVWAPAGVAHEIFAKGDFAMRTLYLEPGLAAAMPEHVYAVDVSPLLRELILHVVGIGMLEAGDPVQARLASVVADQLAIAGALPLSLPLPSDPRAVRLAARLREDPACDLELEALARDAGASARTVQRLFLGETGLRFAEWRQRLRLLHGASLLGTGASVTEAGLDAGYAGTSAFVAAFRRQFGVTPARLRRK
ncbi:MAG: helix-turn-helix transcriptional regulator [Sphingobium sp.]|nr:helix-turn-helix transcriptional regulator [Sphingobium sp.]